MTGNRPPITRAPTGGGRRIRRLGKRSRRWFVFRTASVVNAFAGIISWDLACRLADIVGEALFRLAHEQRGLALENLAQAFGDELTEDDRRRIVRGVFRHFARFAVEFVIAGRNRVRIVHRIVDGSELGRAIDRLRKRGKGVILVTAHTGNWELAGIWAASRYPFNVVARRSYYEPFDRVLHRQRFRLGMQTIYRGDSPRNLLRCLRRNEVLAILADQDLKDVEGVFVDFFGRPAYTPTGPVSLAIRTGAPILMAFVLRKGKRIGIDTQELELARTGDRKEDLRVNTQRWSRALEEFIRKHPDQWPWFHRRWKTTPETLRRRRRMRKADRLKRR